MGADTTSSGDGSPSPPPTPLASRRPTKARQHERIVEATVALLLERGFAGLTIEGVAERTGVAKTTIYRWWPSKEALAAEAVIELGDRVVAVPDTGRLRTDLVALLAEIVASMEDPRIGALLREVVAESMQAEEMREVLRQFSDDRRRASFRVLDRAVARAELSTATDFDLLIDALVGPAYLRFLITGMPLGPDFIDTVVDHVMRAFAPDRANSPR